MKKYGLGKKEKLCSVRAIEILFGPGGAEFSTLAYPLRAVARADEVRASDAPVAFLISIPKKRLRHAVDRVTMRRRVREAYRLNRNALTLPEGVNIDMAFIYVADSMQPYSRIESAVIKALNKISSTFVTEEQ